MFETKELYLQNQIQRSKMMEVIHKFKIKQYILNHNIRFQILIMKMFIKIFIEIKIKKMNNYTKLEI